MFQRLVRGFVRAFLAGVIATAISLAIYRGLIVPRIPGWHEVPPQWWALAFSPYLAAIVVLGQILESPFFALTNGLALTLGSAATTAVWSRLTSGGEATGPVDAPTFWAVLGALIAGTLIAATAIFLAWGTAEFLRRRRAAD